MHIRAATENDGSRVKEMGNKVLAHHAAFDSFYKPVIDTEKTPTPPEKLAFLASDDTGSLAGYIQGVFYGEPHDRSYPFAVIQSIWVEEVARGQGIAQSLINSFEDAVKQKGAKQIDIFVDLQNNLALALWNKAGYETYQEKKRKLI